MQLFRFLLFFLFISVDVHGSQIDRLDSIEKQIPKVQAMDSAQGDSLMLLNSFQDKILSERQSHQQFVENILSSFINYVLVFLSVCGLVFGLVTYFFGNNCREHFSDRFEKNVAEAKNEAMQKLDQFKSEIDYYSFAIEQERKYLSQRISVVQVDPKNIIANEVELLRKAGFRVRYFCDNNSLAGFFASSSNDTDVLVLAVSPEDDLVSLFENFNSKINLASNQIPLVIYVKNANSFLPKLSGQYPLTLSANMPMTLVNSIYTVSKIKSLLRG